MKTAIYQYWYGSKPRESAVAGSNNMKAYAKRIGADYIYETDPAFYGGPCSLEKKYSALRPIYDNSFLKYDKVMYVDLDVFVTDRCTENIFDEDIKHIGICDEPDQPELRTQNVSANTYINNNNDNVLMSQRGHNFGVLVLGLVHSGAGVKDTQNLRCGNRSVL